MEQVRMPSAQPQAASKASGASASAGDDKPEAGDAASARKDGFALLLAALDGAASAQPLAAAGDAVVPGTSTPGAQIPLDDAAADDAILALQQPGKSRLGVKDTTGRAGARHAAAAEGEAKPASAPADALAHASLQDHLTMLLDQGRHTLVGQGLGPDSMIHETARLDATVQPAVGAGARRAGPAMARSAGRASGMLPQAVATLTGADGEGAAAATATATVGASGVAHAAATDQELLKSVLEKMPVGDPRVSLQQAGTTGAPATAAHVWASSAPVAVDAAVGHAPRTDSGGGAQTQGGAGSGGGAAPVPPQGVSAGDLAGGAGQDGALPGSFMEQLGEQVAFWVHQKSQRAEFTLDRDGQPVQVQLSLTGDVAKVTFLTDHAAARQALDAGIDDLRQRLHEQGLALADVNVGVAGGQGGSTPGQGSAHHPRHDAAAGTARVEAAEPVTGAGPRATGLRALDVFV
ncbi:flagellar hook-length control protein FliK [Comamonas sp.]|uniref:flagellar hook-length control protein FliK n=1 Tax=Comamonas sp. TaxID=34028 RepID=UPI001AC3D019|nr:flagellar hook-length control protein FliK [Comamonas sp.]MBN9329880.1 flagellar hook-length control protein FliK [Comamonas sp.]